MLNIYLYDVFFFYAPYLFRSWMMMALHKFLFFVELINVCLFICLPS